MLRWFVQNWIRRKVHETAYQAMTEARKSTSQPRDQGTLRAQAAPPETEETPACQVAVVFAMSAEAGGLVDRLSDVVATRCASFQEHAGHLDGRRVIIAQGGVGRAAAARATADVAAIHHPAWIVSAGFAGALSQQMRRGHILMADHIMDQRGSDLAVGMKIEPHVVQATPGLHVGRLLSVDRLIRKPQEKRRLGEQYDALACDMESFAVAGACRETQVPFLSVRVIIDGVDDQLPPEVTRLLDQDTLAARLGAATGAIFRRPSSAKDMWRLKEDALKASDRLASFLVGVIRQLAE